MLKPNWYVKIGRFCRSVFLKAKEHLLEILVILIFEIFLMYNTLLSGGLPTGGDMLPKLAGTTDRYPFSVWSPIDFGGYRLIGYRALRALINNIFIKNVVLAVKIEMLIIFAISAFSMYIFMLDYCSKRASVIASIAYTVTPFMLIHLSSGHVEALIHALLPLLFYISRRWFTNGSNQYLLALSSLLPLIHLIYPLALGYILPFTLFYIVFVPLLHDISWRVVLKRFFVLILMCLSIGLLLLSPQIIPILAGAYPAAYTEVPSVFSLSLHVTWSVDIFKAMIGFIRSGTYLAMFYSKVDVAILSTTPVLAVTTLLIRKKDKLVLFASLVAAISIFLGKGPRPPLGCLYVMIVENVPYAMTLHVPTTWLLFAIFAYAILLGRLSDALTLYILYIVRKINLPLKIGYFSSHHICPWLLIVPIIIANYSALANGFKTWQPPEEYMAAYEFIARQPGDFRVITVPFMNTKMTEYNVRDIGTYSTFAHGKAVVRPPWYAITDADILKIFTLELMKFNGTDQLMKIWGALNVKYVVMHTHEPLWPPDVSLTQQREFFERQLGLRKVFAKDDVIVYENIYWLPHIFAVKEPILVVGGLDAMLSLMALDGLNLNDYCFIFLNRYPMTISQLSELLKISRIIAFVNSDIWDLIMHLVYGENCVRILPSDFEGSAWEYYNRAPDRILHFLTYNKELLVGRGNSSVSIQVNIPSDGIYEIWIKLYFSWWSSRLIVALNGKVVGEIYPYTSSTHNYVGCGFRWIRIGVVDLNKGEVKLTLNNIAVKGFDMSTCINEIRFIKRGIVNGTLSRVESLLKDHIVIYLFEGEFLSKWSSKFPYLERQRAQTIAFNASFGCHTKLPSRLSLRLLSGGYHLFVRTLSPCFGYLYMQIDNASRTSIQYLPGMPSSMILYDPDNDGIAYWINHNPAFVNITLVPTASSTTNFTNSLKVTVLPGDKGYCAVLEAKVKSEKRNWSNFNYLIIWFRGMGTGKRLWFTAFSGASDWIAFDIRDEVAGWVPLVFKLRSPTRMGGTPDLSNIKYIVIYLDDPLMHGTYYIGPILLCNFTDTMRLEWTKMGAVNIRNSRPPTHITVNIKSNILTDQLCLIRESSIDGHEDWSLEQILKTSGDPPSISYKIISTSRYVIKVRNRRPFMLVFSDRYHPLWSLRGKNMRMSPLCVNWFFNGFYVSTTGEYELILEFVPQRYADIGCMVSLGTLIVITAIIISKTISKRTNGNNVVGL